MATTESAAAGLKISIARMNEHDLVEVCEIEQLTDLSAWGWDAYHAELQSPIDTVMLVARIQSAIYEIKIAGFSVARLIAGELHVNNVAVRSGFRGQKIGSALLETTLKLAQDRKATIAQLEVRAGNEAAQKLYERCGFEVVGRRRDYYRAPTEDALLMSRLL